MKLPLSVIILTYNEEIHIERLLRNIADLASEIFIVDSFSTDKTLDIARTYADCARTNAEKSQNKSVLSRCGSVKVVQHKFENQAQQFNWALDNLEIKNEWILRLDADEYLTEELKGEIRNLLRDSASSLRKSAAFDGYYIKRRVYFMGRWIKHGGYYPTWFLRLFRKNKARSEQREMDEHIVLSEDPEGEQAPYGASIAGKLKNDFIDDNKKGLEDWINKHNKYSTREANERIKQSKTNNQQLITKLGGQVGRKRWLKQNLYLRFPLFFRALLYFIYRYFIRLGFLDGKEGLIFHFLQGFWHQFLIDAKIYEQKKIKKS